jgi:hypothetical protein
VSSVAGNMSMVISVFDCSADTKFRFDGRRCEMNTSNYIPPKVNSRLADTLLRGEVTTHEQFRTVSPSAKFTCSGRANRSFSPNGKRTHQGRTIISTTPAITSNSPEPSPAVFPNDQFFRPGAFGRVWLPRNQISFQGNHQLSMNAMLTSNLVKNLNHR